MDSHDVERLYESLLDACNHQDASVVGFDGSLMNGRAEIAAALSHIFSDHASGRYVGIVKDVRFLTSNCAMLRAVSGLVPAARTTFIRPSMRSKS